MIGEMTLGAATAAATSEDVAEAATATFEEGATPNSKRKRIKREED